MALLPPYIIQISKIKDKKPTLGFDILILSLIKICIQVCQDKETKLDYITILLGFWRACISFQIMVDWR